MITVEDAIRSIFEIYFQRSFNPELHENCHECKRELSTEEMEKDLEYQEKLTKLFLKKMTEIFSDSELLFIAKQISDPLILNFMREAFVFCEEDVALLRRSIFGDSDSEPDERRII